MRDRGWRRTRTEKIARKRLRVWVEQGQNGYSTWAPAVGYFRKTKPFHCGCRKRKPGAPRRDIGQCDYGQRARIYRWRQEARELALAELLGDDHAAVGVDARSGRVLDP